MFSCVFSWFALFFWSFALFCLFVGGGFNWVCSCNTSHILLEFFVRAPEIDITELESLFSAASASDGSGTKGGGRRGSNMNKPEKVQLVSSYVRVCAHMGVCVCCIFVCIKVVLCWTIYNFYGLIFNFFGKFNIYDLLLFNVIQLWMIRNILYSFNDKSTCFRF